MFDLQNFEDEDVGATLEWLKEKLADNIKLLSSWDKYKKEVLSGSLEWSPMHTSEGFWLENSPKFEERDCQVRHYPCQRKTSHATHEYERDCQVWSTRRRRSCPAAWSCPHAPREGVRLKNILIFEDRDCYLRHMPSMW